MTALATVRSHSAAIVRTATLATVLVASTTGSHVVPQIAAHAGAAHEQATAAAAGAVPSDFREFTTWIADDISTYWEAVYGANGSFVRPEIVFFTDPIASPCDDESTAEEGPYYCDNVVYIPDAWFAAQPDLRLNDFAVAYVIAHEIGHDVQDTQGILASLNSQVITSVQVELQADCLAGVWAANANQRGMLEAGDLDEAVAIATSIGDDTLGFTPDEYTHGTSAQRVAWFEYGLQTGDGASCATY